MNIHHIVNYYEAAAQFEVTPEEALEFFLAKGLSRSFRWDDMVSQEHDIAFTVAKLMNQDLLDFVKQELDRVIANGDTFADFAEQVMPALQRRGWWGKRDVIDPLTGQVIEARLGSASRLETIFRTNLQSAYAKGQWENIQDTKDTFPYLMYDAVDDSRTRPEHAAWDGIVLPADHPFWQTHYPPNGYNCFLPGTKIQGDIQSAMRSWYSGKAYEVTTRSGRSLRVTADHPILTDRGWVQAKLINTSDNLLSEIGPVDGSVSGGVSDNEDIPSAEYLFEALATQALSFSKGASLQLNSDATGRKIHVTTIDSGLTVKIQSQPHTFVKEDIFKRGRNGWAVRTLNAISPALTNVRSIDPILAQDTLDIPLADTKLFSNDSLAGFLRTVSSKDLAFDTIIASIGSSPCRGHLPFNATRRLFDGLPLDQFGLRPGTDGDALLDKLSSDGVTADLKLFSYLLDAHSSEVLSDPVVDIREFDFSGHVYDFQSAEAVVFADGILAHNCRCGVIQLTWDDIAEYGLRISGQPNVKWRIHETADGRQIAHPEGVDPTFI